MKYTIALILLILSTTQSNAATYYVCGSASSCNSGNGSPSGWSTGASGNSGLSKAAPKATIAQGIALLTTGAGDTLIIGNGNYVNQQILTAPSGTSGAYTKIHAENTGGAVIDMSSATAWDSCGLRTGGDDHHIEFDGLKIRGNPALGDTNGVVEIYGSYIKLFRIAAYGQGEVGTNYVFATMSGSHHILIEECWVWGGGRYKFLAYESSYVVMRRCVSRHDWNDDGGGDGRSQQACFTNYDSSNTLFQNCIAIDSGAVGTPQTMYGAWWDENNAAVLKTGKITSSIILNIRTNFAGMHDKPSGNRTIENSIIWDSNGGWGTADYYGYSAPTISINKMTIGQIIGNYDSGWPIAQGTGVKYGVSGGSTTVTDSIITGAADYGLAEWVTNDYISFYNNGANYGGLEHTPTAGAHNITNINPLTNCLKYLPRIESANCSLYTAGSSGGRIGAEILYKHGTSGTLYGETGYDTLTSEPLWPFPNEDLIKADYATYSAHSISGARGFAATGNQLDGATPITLTSYIWEYLGNEMPAEIYGEEEPVAVAPLTGGSCPGCTITQ